MKCDQRLITNFKGKTTARRVRMLAISKNDLDKTWTNHIVDSLVSETRKDLFKKKGAVSVNLWDVRQFVRRSNRLQQLALSMTNPIKWEHIDSSSPGVTSVKIRAAMLRLGPEVMTRDVVMIVKGISIASRYLLGAPFGAASDAFDSSMSALYNAETPSDSDDSDEEATPAAVNMNNEGHPICLRMEQQWGSLSLSFAKTAGPGLQAARLECHQSLNKLAPELKWGGSCQPERLCSQACVPYGMFNTGKPLNGASRSLKQMTQIVTASRSVCAIETSRGDFLGTGFLIGAWHVMTCAHVLLTNDRKSWTQDCTCVFDVEGTKIQKTASVLFPRGEHFANLSHIVGEIGMDVALVKLNEPVKSLKPLELRDKPSFIDTDSAPNDVLQAVTLVGILDDTVHLTSGWIICHDRWHVAYSNASAEGMSGSPIVDADGFVVGIHRAGGVGKGTSSRVFYNLGLRLDLVVDSLFRWEERLVKKRPSLENMYKALRKCIRT